MQVKQDEKFKVPASGWRALWKWATSWIPYREIWKTEADTQKRLFDIENEKKKTQEMRKKQWKDLERQENVMGKMKVALVIKKQQHRSA